MKKKMTVTIAIPAYNEEANIAFLLSALLKQKHTNFTLKNILVYTDASTDNTITIVRKFAQKNKKIIVHEGKQRKGKYFRVNQIFHDNRSDMLVVLDADIALVGDHFLEALAQVILKDKKALLVSAHQILVRPKGFIPRILYHTFTMWDDVRLSIPHYDSAINYFGSATAYRGTFAKSVIIPRDLLDPHLYIYLMAKKQNGFRYCLSAKILQWPITTFTDLEKFLRRSIGKQDKKIEKLFGQTIAEIYYVPRKIKVIGVWKAFLKEPFYTPLAVMVGIIMAKKAHSIQADKTPVWDIVTSTKKPMIFEGKEVKV